MRHRVLLLAALGAVLMHGAARAAMPAPLSVCIDSASETAARDLHLAERVARHEGAQLDVTHFNSGDDDDAMSPKAFARLLNKSCDLLMGYPVDPAGGFDMPGIMRTKPYDETGFVLVVPANSSATSLADLPSGTSVGVTFETAPNLYFLRHPNITPDVQDTDAQTLAAVVDGKVRAAIVWQPTVLHYLQATPSAHVKFVTLHEPHARYAVVALYTAHGAAAAASFDQSLASLHHANTPSPAGLDHAMIHRQRSDGFNPAFVIRAAMNAPANPATPPALFTTAQAQAGAAKFVAHCQQCHGAQLQGVVGPALKGPNFASVKSGFAVGDIFMIVSQNMPASAPGTLQKDDYVQIMAFLLQQNGYPAGQTALTYDGALNSNVPLVYQGK